MTRLLLALSLILSACASVERSGHTAAPPDIAPVAGDPSLLQIVPAALGRPFVLAPVVVRQTATPEVEYLKARLIVFRDNGHEIGVFEYNPHVLYEDLGAEKLLGSFRVVSRAPHAIRFRCVPVLGALSLAPSWGASDEEDGFAPQVAASEPVLPVVAAWARETRLLPDGVRLAQVVRVSVPSDGEELTATLQADIWAYRANDRFAALLSTQQQKVGFFEIPHTVSRVGAVTPIAMRWDLSQEAGPITVRLTSNVPEHLRDAVAEGVTYWNRVLGWDALRVETGAPPGALPERREIIVRWITWDTAGFSQASFQAHPLTGEIFRAEVMLTSAFAEVRSVALSGGAADESHAGARGISWPGRACRRETTRTARTGAAPRELRAKATEDYLRVVTAHEIGHALGLRHNFAGSLETEFDTPDAHARAWDAYVRSQGSQGARTSSTVMDYLDVLDDVLLGERIRSEALPYDLLAARWAYRGASLEEVPSRPAFCTDSLANRDRIIGCDRFDGGSNPVAVAARAAAFRIAQLPAELVAAMTKAQSAGEMLTLPSPEERAGRIDVDELADEVLGRVASVLRQAQGGAIAWGTLDANGAVPISARLDLAQRASRTMLEQAGGVRGVVMAAAGPLANDPEWLASEARRLVTATPAAASDTAAPGKVRDLTVGIAAQLQHGLFQRLTMLLQMAHEDEDVEEDVEEEEEGADERRRPAPAEQRRMRPAPASGPARIPAANAHPSRP